MSDAPFIVFDRWQYGGVFVGTHANRRLIRGPAAGLALATALLLSLLAGPGSSGAAAQTFIPQGPAPSFGPVGVIQSGDQPPNGMNGTVTGAIQAIAISPTTPGTMFVGATNGGIWETRNGGSSWQPLTDNKTSLSVSSLAYDPTNANNMIAGIGATSNGRIGDARGGQLVGIMYSSNGGASWNQIAGNDNFLDNKNIIAVAARGNNLLAGANFSVDSTGTRVTGGLYYSPNNGVSFAPVQGLTTGNVFAIASDNSASNANGNGTRFYASVNGAPVSTNNGVYLGDPTKATAWTQVLSLPANQVAKLASGPGGSVAAAVYDSSTQKLVGIYLSQDSGKTWTAMTSNLPNTNPGGQAANNLVIAIDPSNSKIIYIAGDRSATSPNSTVSAFRLTQAGSGFTVDTLTDQGTANNSTVHADARAITFDAAGQLVFGTDGGIYVRSNPTSNAGIWTGLNTTGLAVREIYSIAYDSISKRLLVAAQDTGTAFQDQPNSARYNAVGGGDGVNAAVNDKSFSDASIVYFSSQSLGNLERRTYNASGKITSDTSINNLNFEPDDLSQTGDDGKPTVPFGSLLVLNRKDPLKIAVGTNYIYTTTDDRLLGASNQLTVLGRSVGSIDQSSTVTALAYGTNDDEEAVLAGSTWTAGGFAVSGLFLASRATNGSLVQLTNYQGNAPTSVVFDYRSSQHYYAADGTNLWTNADATTATAFTSLTPNLNALNLIRPTALEFISQNGVNALVVGALSTVGGRPLAVADSATPGTLDNWRLFGDGLPNAIIGQLSYNPKADVLAVGSFGRGAWLLYDVTTYFDSATVLVYGAADNDSAPDSRFLTNGNYASRDLVKVGAGTLTINGNTQYTGSTSVLGGTLVANGSLLSSSDLTVGAGGTLRGTGTMPATTVFGTIYPGNNALGTLSINSALTFQQGSLFNVDVAPGQSGRIAVNGSASLQGTVAPQVQTGTYAPRSTYTILSTTGGLSGSFANSSVNSPYQFLLPSLSYDANNAYLTLTIGGFLSAAQNPVQAAVAGALDSSVLQASGDFATVLSNLATLNASQVQPILTSLSGTNYSGFSNSMVQTAQLFMSNFLDQAGGTNRNRNKIALAEACEVACDTTEPPKWGAWGGGLGGLGTVGAGQSLGGVTYNLGGFAGGLDRRFGDTFLAGVAVGYTTGSQWVSGFTGQGFSNTVQAGVYGSYLQGPVYVDGIVGYAYTANQLNRSINIPGMAGRTAVGQTGANQAYGQVESGWRFDIGTAAEAFVTPFARLQAYTGTQSGFTESGAQSLGLNVAAQTTSSLRSVLGAQLGGAMALGWQDKLHAQLRLGWSHEYADTSRPVSASLVGAPSAPFTTYGATPSRDGAVVGLGLNTAIADATSLYLRYEANIAGQDSSHALTAGVRMTW